jgi:hypothetical protein
MVPVPVLAFVHFGRVPVLARYITGTGIKWCLYPYWHFCTFVQYQYGYGTLPVLALNGASTGSVKEYYEKRHSIYDSIRIVSPHLGALLELVICAKWYPVVQYSSDNGSKKNAITHTDPHTRNDISITGNGNLCILVQTHV